jgi:hypothetical protein
VKDALRFRESRILRTCAFGHWEVPKPQSVRNESLKKTKKHEIAEPNEKLKKLIWNQNVFCSCWY